VLKLLSSFTKANKRGRHQKKRKESGTLGSSSNGELSKGENFLITTLHIKLFSTFVVIALIFFDELIQLVIFKDWRSAEPVRKRSITVRIIF
jgi:hypothetical protein